MARDHQPMTDEELAAAKAEIDELRQDVREALAEDLGGDLDDYDATRQSVPEGGE